MSVSEANERARLYMLTELEAENDQLKLTNAAVSGSLKRAEAENEAAARSE